MTTRKYEIEFSDTDGHVTPSTDADDAMKSDMATVGCKTYSRTAIGKCTAQLTDRQYNALVEMDSVKTITRL